uniref:Uncharacterized protein n=1 Tax=Arundo donax TaxID=35708 RepID=A0A0A9EA68_ARUDO
MKSFGNYKSRTEPCFALEPTKRI